MRYKDIFLYILNYKPLFRRRWINLTLRFLMMLIMISPLTLSVTNIIMDGKSMHIPFIIFYLFGPVQYLLGLQYIKTGHLESILADCKKVHYSLKPINRLIVIISIITILGIITSIFILAFTGPPLEFSLLLGKNIHLDRFVYIWFITNWVFSSYAVSLNTSIFSFVFYKHLEDLKELENDLTSEMIWNMDQTSFTELTRRIIGIKYVIKSSVGKLQSFFTSTTTIGAVAVGSVVHFKELNAYLIYYIILYFISIFLYFSFIYKISMSKDSVLSIITSPTVMYKYLTNVKSMHNIDILRKEMIELKKIDPGRVHTLNKFKIAAYSPVTFDHVIDIDNSVSYSNNNVEAEVLTLCYKNNAAIDWLILEGVLKDKWTGFELFGISFDGIDVIKKGIGVVGAIVLISSFVSSLNII